MAEVTASVGAEAATRGFKLLRVQDGLITHLLVGKKVKFLNHGSKDVEYLGKVVKPATQDDLKSIYDTDPSYAQLIEAPQGHKAPWHGK